MLQSHVKDECRDTWFGPTGSTSTRTAGKHPRKVDSKDFSDGAGGTFPEKQQEKPASACKKNAREKKNHMQRETKNFIGF